MKQVAEIASAVMKDGYVLDREKSGHIMNPADCAALEQALLIKDVNEASITVMSMGTEYAESLLKQVAPFDIEQLILITDKSYGGSDTLATATILKRAIDLLGPFDLVLMGRKAIDGETGHVGPEVAALLGTTCITNVTKISTVDEKVVLCDRLLEDSRVELSVEMPTVITICGGVNRLRPASILGMRKAKSKEVIRLTNAQLMLEADEIGTEGSPTWVSKVVKMEDKPRQGIYYYDSVNGAKAIVDAILLYREGKLANKTGNNHVRLAQKKPKGLHGVCVFMKDEESLKAGASLIAHCMGSGCDTVKIEVNDRNCYDDLQVALSISEILSEIHLSTLVFPGTVLGRSVGPMVAALKGLGITADCTEISYLEDGTMVQIRPAFGQEVLAEIRTKTSPQLASVRPYVYNISEKHSGKSVTTVEVTPSAGKVQLVSGAEIFNHRLEDATAIISGGKVCGSTGFALLSNMTGKLGFSIGASRSAVDEGYAPYEMQIGQTGRIVKPQLYIAFGLSGSVHHLAGMRNSGYIVAVNTDPKAKIFDYADICIVADWKETAQAVMDKLGLD